jgi:hypothetical protein
MKTITKFIYLAFAALGIACFALSPRAQAVNPPPDGGYAGGNTAEGQNALFSLTTGGYNTAVGFFSLRSNATNSFNTGIGAGALLLNTGDNNTATGAAALLFNTTGFENTANGAFALFSNTGDYNTATGFQALYNNTTGFENTANGWQALYSNTTGSLNAAFGLAPLTANTTGHRNTAIGNTALYLNTEGYRNTAIGFGSLQINTIGNFNAACGNATLAENTTGNQNAALGWGAGWNLTTGDNNIDIGNLGVPGESNTIRIGTVVKAMKQDFVFPVHTATYIAGINGQTAAGGVAVFIDSDGKLGTVTSSARFKTDIKAMDKSSETILALKPVTFRYKQKIDPKGIPQFGLVAEEVEKVNPDLVVRDAEGKVYTVRYEAVNAMLLNEFLKEHRQVQEQQKQIEKLAAQLKEQAEQIRKVNDKVEMAKPTAQVAVSDR